MRIIGLTGPSGSGKTVISDFLKEKGFFVIDCDKVAREVAKSEEVLNKLQNAFGDILADGVLDRKKLAKLAFSTKENTKKLNDIMLPKIVKNIEEIIEVQSGDILLDAPTLFESGLDKRCKAVIAVLADEEIRKERLIKRDNLTTEQLYSRLKAAKPDEYYKERTSHIIYNNGDISSAKKNIVKILKGV